MNKAWILLALLLAWPGFAQAESEGQRPVGVRGDAPRGDVIGGVAADTTFRIFRVNPLGQLSIVDESKDRDGNVLFQDAIPTTTLAYNAACSTAVLNTHDLAHAVLYLRLFIGGGATAAADTTNIGRICIQLRGHLNGQSDSSSTFVFYPLGQVASIGVSATAADTLNQGHIFKGGRNLPWSGEFVMTASAARQSYGNAIAFNGKDFYYPGNTYAIPLDNLFGRNWWSPYTSIRIRNIGPSTNAVTVQAHIVGTPL